MVEAENPGLKLIIDPKKFRRQTDVGGIEETSPVSRVFLPLHVHGPPDMTCQLT